MKLKEFTRLTSDGCLKTHLALNLNCKHPPLTESDGSISIDLGSTDNGGITNLTKLGNALANLLLSSTVAGHYDGIGGSRNYGLVYLAQHLLKQRGFPLDAPDNESVDSKSILLLPSLIAALLDSELSPRTKLVTLNRRIYCPQETSFTIDSIWEVMLMVRKLLADSRQLGESIADDNIRTDISSRLQFWAEVYPFEMVGMEYLASHAQLLSLCVGLRKQVESQGLIQWDAVCENLNDIKVYDISLSGVHLLLTSRITATQISILRRLKVPLPPLLIHETVIPPVAPRSSIAVKMTNPTWELDYHPEYSIKQYALGL